VAAFWKVEPVAAFRKVEPVDLREARRIDIA
jgi:hypothetical protein